MWKCTIYSTFIKMCFNIMLESSLEFTRSNYNKLCYA